jgi:type II pantothenate kinase
VTADGGGRHAVEGGQLTGAYQLPEGATGMDAGLTLTKIARVHDGVVSLSVHPTQALGEAAPAAGAAVGITGARMQHGSPNACVEVQEIDAASRGARMLLTASGRSDPQDFVLALVGTGTAFAAVRERTATHLGGTALGGGSFAGIARSIEPTLDYSSMIARAERGDRRRVDTMVSDAYPEGIGRIGPELTAAHLAKLAAGDPRSAELDDVMAALLNLHAENIAQIAASRALVAQLPLVVLAGGFVHNNLALVRSLTTMIARFGVQAELAPWPGFAGALGAAVIASEVQAAELEVQE